MSFADSYLGRLRRKVGSELLIVAGVRVAARDPSGRVLLQLRTDFGVWGLPGGALEPGEGFDETAHREFVEETGVAAPALTAFGLASNPAFETASYPNGDACQFVSLCLTGRYDAAPVGLAGDPAETLRLDWFDLDDPPDMLTTHRRTLDALRQFDAEGAFQLF